MGLGMTPTATAGTRRWTEEQAMSLVIGMRTRQGVIMFSDSITLDGGLLVASGLVLWLPVTRTP